MSKKHDHLNECLERLIQGEELESCLKDYPEEADELHLLIKMAGEITRFLIALRFGPELSIVETALAIGEEDEGTVKKLQHEALIKLRRLMEQ